MRRAIAAAVTGGLVLGGALATPAFATAQGAGKAVDRARTVATAKPPAGKSVVHQANKKTKKPARATKALTAMKTVVYKGYEFQVPASWPVYRLDEHPRTCVRYDVHAVYLGTPGADMRCAAGLVGRTQRSASSPARARRPGQARNHPATPPSPRHPAAPCSSGCRRSTARSRRTPSTTS